MFAPIMYYGDNYILIDQKTGRFYESVELPKHPVFSSAKELKELDKSLVEDYYNCRLTNKTDPLWDWEKKACVGIF